MSIKLKVELKGDFNKSLLDKLKKKANLKVGFFADATYPNGASVAEVASFNEFGTHAIPPRPFMRNAIDKNSARWIKYAGDLITGGVNIEYALGRTGEIVRADIIRSINATTTPPNAPATIERKGSSHPLIDTGFMKSSVTYKVIK